VFSIPAARLGLGYRYSAMKNLVDLIGPGAAKDLFFTARKIDAAEAQFLGFISRVVEPSSKAALKARTMPKAAKPLWKNARLCLSASSTNNKKETL
jgi:enoyl-CoA hydratase/carnithine racemase